MTIKEVIKTYEKCPNKTPMMEKMLEAAKKGEKKNG